MVGTKLHISRCPFPHVEYENARLLSLQVKDCSEKHMEKPRDHLAIVAAVCLDLHAFLFTEERRSNDSLVMSGLKELNLSEKIKIFPVC